MILSAAMMLRFAFDLQDEADAIEKAVDASLQAGYHTGDLSMKDGKQVGTKEMTQVVIDNIS